MSRKRSSWPQLWFDCWGASFEAQQVIGLRLVELAGGGAEAIVEANRMVSEKMAAAVEAQQAAATAIMTGNALQIPMRTAAIYRRKVRANRKRLATTRSVRSKRARTARGGAG